MLVSSPRHVGYGPYFCIRCKSYTHHQLEERIGHKPGEKLIKICIRCPRTLPDELEE